MRGEEEMTPRTFGGKPVTEGISNRSENSSYFTPQRFILPMLRGKERWRKRHDHYIELISSL